MVRAAKSTDSSLADGTMVLPVEGSLDGVEGSHFMRLAPGAIVWQRAGFTSGGSQPALAQRSDGSLLALLRHSRNITEIESRDGGQTWSQARPTALKNPDSGISMRALANGHWVLVYNDSQVGRTPLSIVRSLDEGKTWEKSLQLESNPGEYSYPCIIQASDGRIHITYTFRRYAIKHVELNEDWLMHFEHRLMSWDRPINPKDSRRSCEFRHGMPVERLAPRFHFCTAQSDACFMRRTIG